MKINKLVSLKQAKEIMYKHGVGVSAESILGKHLKKKNIVCDYPYDYGDLMRCIGVVRAFNIDIDIMKDTNYIWNRIIGKWDILVEKAMSGEDYTVGYMLQQIRIEPKTSKEIVDESNFIISITRSEPCETAKRLKITKVKRDKNA